MRSSNLAYAIRHQEQESNLEVSQRPRIRQVRPSKTARQKHQLRRTMLAVAYVLLLSAALIYGKVKLTEENATLMAATASYQQMQTEYAQLEAAASGKVSLKNVELQARQLGLGEIKSTQVENIVVAQSNEVEVSKNKNGFEGWWNDLLAYILG